MKTYAIVGGNFKLDDGTIKCPGDFIELEDDVAAYYAPHLVELPAAPPARVAADIVIAAPETGAGDAPTPEDKFIGKSYE